MLTWVVPTSMAYLGAIFMVLAVVLVLVDVPGKGVPWDKVGAVFALLGGFGVGGAVGGWLGEGFAAMAGGLLSAGQRLTAQAVGAGVIGAIIAGLMLWAYSRITGKGITAKSKFKSLLLVGCLGVVGTVLAAIPNLYGWADSAVAWAGNSLLAAFT